MIPVLKKDATNLFRRCAIATLMSLPLISMDAAFGNPSRRVMLPYLDNAASNPVAATLLSADVREYLRGLVVYSEVGSDLYEISPEVAVEPEAVIAMPMADPALLADIESLKEPVEILVGHDFHAAWKNSLDDLDYLKQRLDVASALDKPLLEAQLARWEETNQILFEQAVASRQGLSSEMKLLQYSRLSDIFKKWSVESPDGNSAEFAEKWRKAYQALQERPVAFLAIPMRWDVALVERQGLALYRSAYPTVRIAPLALSGVTVTADGMDSPRISNRLTLRGEWVLDPTIGTRGALRVGFTSSGLRGFVNQTGQVLLSFRPRGTLTNGAGDALVTDGGIPGVVCLRRVESYLTSCVP